jgi:carboxymethylenebutenolidase
MQRLDATRDWAGKNGGDIARLGIIGFGPGGRAAWLYAAFSPALKAAIAWGGPMQGTTSPARPITALEVAGQLNAPLLGLYGKNDGTPQRILLDAEARAKKAGKTADIVSYVGAGQNFAVPGAASFDEAATIDGWQRTLKWLRDHGVS